MAMGLGFIMEFLFAAVAGGLRLVSAPGVILGLLLTGLLSLLLLMLVASLVG